MTKFFGCGVKWGIGVSGMTGSGIASFQPEKLSVKRVAKKAEVADGNGDTAGVIYYDFKKELTVSVKPSAATLALAKTQNVMPLPGTKVTFVDSTDSEVQGDWLVDDSSKEASPEGTSVISISLTQYANAAVQTEVTS